MTFDIESVLEQHVYALDAGSSRQDILTSRVRMHSHINDLMRSGIRISFTSAKAIAERLINEQIKDNKFTGRT